MPTTLLHKEGIPHEVDMFDLLPPQEGSMNQYYGRIGEGKTYAATVDALQDLAHGQVVYTSWKLDWQGYDERKSIWNRILFKLGLKKYFWIFPKENWRYFDMNADDALDQLGKLRDCIMYLDEGHLLLDSYLATKMERKDRATILHTRHFDRTINVISQRPTAIHVVVRANVNRFFKLEKVFDHRILWKWRIVRFRKTEFQDTGADDKPDETIMIDPESGQEIGYKNAVSTVHYFSRQKYRDAYDTKYLRSDMTRSQEQEAKRVLLDGKPYPLTEDELKGLVDIDEEINKYRMKRL